MRIFQISFRSFSFIAVLCLLVLAAAAQSANTPPPGISGGAYKIAGTLVSKTDAHPLAHARVTIRDVKNSDKFASLVTDEDGKFEFSGLPAGKYSLNGSKRGYISAAYDQHDQFSTAIVTGAGLDTETLQLRLAPAAIIAGKILDEGGDPVRHAMVSVYYDDHSNGVDQIHMFRSAQTNDQGVYEITPLMPGTYFLSASAKPWYALHPTSESDNGRDKTNSQGQTETDQTTTFDRSLDVAYLPTYYPDATDADSATPIPVRGGERIEVDMHLNPVPALTLTFRVPQDGKTGFMYPQLQQPAFDSDTSVQTGGVRRVSPGVMEISGIPAGHYNVRLFGGGTQMQMNGVDLTKDGEEIDTSRSEAMSTVKVLAQIPGDATPLAQLRIGLRSGHRLLSAWKPLDDKGEAELPQIPAGKYDVQVWGPPKPYSIAHMTAEGATVSGRSLTVAAGASVTLALTLVGGSAELEGTAKRVGKAFAGAMVVLVPKNPERDHDLFRRDQSDLDGTFSLHNVVPGSYTLLAIENGWDLDWSQPSVISTYLHRGRKIEVGSQPGRPITIAEGIEVQSK
jgi:uncharacterized surface anchored protein